MCCNECAHLKCPGLDNSSLWSSTFTVPCCQSRHTRPATPPLPAQATAQSTSPPSSSPYNFNPVQINICLLRGEINSLVDIMASGCISIAAIQETHIGHNTSLKTSSGYSIIHADRAKERQKGRSLAFLVHQSIQYWVLDLPIPPGDKHLKQKAIKVMAGKTSITTANVYCPSSSSCTSGFELSLQHLLQLKDALILRDINAHNELWNSVLPEDSFGGQLAREIKDSSFTILNKDASTRVKATMASSPNISLVSQTLFMGAIWETEANYGIRPQGHPGLPPTQGGERHEHPHIHQLKEGRL